MKLIKASKNEFSHASNIYEAVKGGEFCAWDESYPTAERAMADAEAGCLYLLKSGKEIIGCASIEPISEDNDLPFWQINDETHREIARIAILPQHQGKGYARLMVGMLLDEMKTQGVRSVHLLAAKMNPPALKTYLGLGFEILGECYRYGHDYYVCEKLI